MQAAKPHVVVLDDYEHAFTLDSDWGEVINLAHIRVYHQKLTGQDLLDAVSQADCVVLNRDRTPVDAVLLERMPNLKLISFTGTRNTALDMGAIQSRQIPVAYTEWGPSKDSTAELTWTLIMASCKRLLDQTALLAQGQWRNSNSLLPVLHGETLGLIGLGEIGQRVARYAKAFGMKVLAWSPNLTPERAAPHGVEAVELNELLAQSKWISLHLVPSAQTKGLMNINRLSLMRKDAFLVNTSRSALIHTPDLIEALKAGLLAGAALDVYDQEPLPQNDPLRNCPNLLLTPHLGFIAQPVYESFKKGTVENLSLWLKGLPLPRLL